MSVFSIKLLWHYLCIKSLSSATSILKCCTFLWTSTYTTSVYMSVWSFIHQLTPSAFPFYECCAHGFSWTRRNDLVGHHLHHLLNYQLNHEHFKLLRCFQVLQFWPYFFRFLLGAKVFHINYSISSTSAHSKTLHINMTWLGKKQLLYVGRCILTVHIKLYFRWTKGSWSSATVMSI